MNILHVRARYAIRGGEDEACDAQMRVLREAGHECHEFTLSNKHVDPLTGAWRCFGSHAVAQKLVERLETYGPFDMAHLHNLHMAIGPEVIRVLHAWGVPMVMPIRNYRFACASANFRRDGHDCRECLNATGWSREIGLPGIVHGCYRGRLATAAVSLGRRANRGTYDKVGVFIAVSEHVREELVKAGAAPWRVVTVPDVICPDPGMAKPTNATHGVFAGRLCEEKGVDVLLEALAFLRRVKEQVEVRIIGDGELRPRVEEAARDGLVTYLGPLPHHAVLREFARAKFGVVPSVWAEPLGLVSVEMAACGKPVTVADSGGLPETVHAPIWTHRAGDHLDLASKISVLHGMGSAEAGWYGVKQRQHYERKFSPAAHLPRLLAAYGQAERWVRYVPPEPVPMETGRAVG